MEIKLFGKKLFEMTSGNGGLPTAIRWNGAIDEINNSDYLPDFYKYQNQNSGSTSESYSGAWATLTDISTGTINGITKVGKLKEKFHQEKPEKPKAEISPKGVFEMKMLNDQTFKIKTDPKYLDEQIETFKEKLGMIKSTEWDMNRGTVEIASVLKRFENRKKYTDFKEFYEEFPYTTTARIADLTKEHIHLKIGQVEQFLADMPKEAVDVMKKYAEQTKKLCDKKPIFYIIANKKDFEKTQTRRDPILLAQSPFGHFWQILGAWDSEMLLIEEL